MFRIQCQLSTGPQRHPTFPQKNKIGHRPPFDMQKTCTLIRECGQPSSYQKYKNNCNFVGAYKEQSEHSVGAGESQSESQVIGDKLPPKHFYRQQSQSDYNHFKISRRTMRLELKAAKDEDFTPKDIRKRTSYRKISEDLKNLMAHLYYVEHVKMAKLVKKYNISFSTITDILNKYDSNAQRIQKSHQKECTVPSVPSRETPSKSLKQQMTSEVKAEQPYPSPLLDMESPHNPQYLYYQNGAPL